MGEKIMKNFPIEYKGQTYWRSRSVAVVGFIFCMNKNGKWCILAEKRGPGCPNEVGKWCVPCGYLDYNETGEMAVARETFEETGLNLHHSQFNFDSISFSSDGEQNVNLRYICVLLKPIQFWKLSNEHNEEGETSDIRWIRLDKIHEYDWAFGHRYLIPEMAEKVGINW